MESLQTIQQKISTLKDKLDYSNHQKLYQKLKQDSENPDIWDNPQEAKNTMQQLSYHQEIIDKVDNLTKDINSLIELNQLLETNPDLEISKDLENSISQLEVQLKELELQTYLSGKYDKNYAIFSIHSGQGGTEAMDWASMLQRMYQRYFERKNWTFELLDSTPGEEAGIKSASFKISAPNAYGLLRREGGTHRLVRLSPFNADNLRQTSFAKVEVTPVLENDDEVKINPEEVEFAAFRSGGSGGQNVNKVSTAVRLVHRPTGITVSCQSQRSQDQNRLLAMQMLSSKLWAIEQEKRDTQMSDIKGKNVNTSWGHHIRSYVLHPYKMVKDLRTKYETSDTTSVLDGNLDDFIQAELKL